MSVVEFTTWMVLQGKTMVEIYEATEKFLKKFPRKCDCGKTLTAEDVFSSQGSHCEKCWKKLTEELHKEDQEKQKNL